MNHEVDRSFVRPGERLDDLQLNGLYIIQNPAFFCFGADAVCLSDFARVKKNESVMDLCTGSGIIPILLSAKTEGRFFTGAELQQEMAEMAQRSVFMNRLQNRVSIENLDIKKAPEKYGTGAFDVITVNPPYLKQSFHNREKSVALARHEIACTLEDIVSVSALLLKKGGRLYMVHRPHRLVDVFYLLRKNNIEPKVMQAVHARIDDPPSFILIEAVQGGKPWLECRPAYII